MDLVIETCGDLAAVSRLELIPGGGICRSLLGLAAPASGPLP